MRIAGAASLHADDSIAGGSDDSRPYYFSPVIATVETHMAGAIDDPDAFPEP